MTCTFDLHVDFDVLHSPSTWNPKATACEISPAPMKILFRVFSSRFHAGLADSCDLQAWSCDSLKPPNLVCVEFRSQAAVFGVIVEDLIDGDEHLAGDSNERLVVWATFCDSIVELAESRVVS